MTGTLLSQPVLRAVDANGAPIPGAQMQFYVTGTTTPTPVYSASGLATPLSNPVIADSGGLFAPIFLDPTVIYRVQLLNGSGSLIRDVDPVNGPITNGAGSITGAMLQSGAVAANLGFTPLNRGGDTATNLLLAFSGPTRPAASAGYLGAPPNEQDGAYTFALSDMGGMVRAGTTTSAAWTIPPNSAVGFPVGAVILLRNWIASSGTLTRGTGVSLYLAAGTTNKDITLAPGALATLIKELPDSWVISGSGIS